MTPSFSTLVRLEPRLAELDRDLRLEPWPPAHCRFMAWQPVKRALHALVGPGRRGGHHPVLSTRAALDAAAGHLHALLPPCRGRACSCDG